MAIPSTGDIAKRAEQVRDLKQQVEGLATEALPGVVFIEIDEGREPVTIYSTEDGRPVTIPAYMVPPVLDRRREDGEFRFVAEKARAPEYKMGTLLCFMHPDAPERATLDAAGLTGKTCRKHTLPNDYAKTIHGEHRHKQEWAAYMRYVAGQKEAVREARQDKQLEATLTIARAAQGSQAVEAKAPQAVETDCPRCDWQQRPATKNRRAALAAHGREKHPSLVQVE